MFTALFFSIPALIYCYGAAPKTGLLVTTMAKMPENRWLCPVGDDIADCLLKVEEPGAQLRMNSIFEWILAKKNGSAFLIQSSVYLGRVFLTKFANQK